MFAILNPSRNDGDDHLHRVAKLHKSQTKWIPIHDTEKDTQNMNMAICYYMDDMIRHRNEIGDWSDNLTICCIEPGYQDGEKYQLEEYLDGDPPLLAVHLQTWKEPPQDDRPQDRECYYSLVIQRGASGVQLLVYLMTGNKQGPCQRDNKYMHMRWVRCLDLVRVILQKAWELPAACSFGPFAEYRNPKKDLDAKDWENAWQLRRARLDNPGMYHRLLTLDIWLRTPPQYSSDGRAYGHALDMDIPHPHVWDPPGPRQRFDMESDYYSENDTT